MPVWPDLTEYHEALQHPARSFADPALQQARIEQDRFGMPQPATGANAVVYKAMEQKNVWAVRCFLRPISDHAERYAAISKHLQKAKAAHTTPFIYLNDGIRLNSSAYPVVKMAWVAGEHFDRHVEKQLANPKALASLRSKFRKLVQEIEDARFAHGDLQHGNVLVCDGELLLIDYDGMWVPSLNGRKATEIGHCAYQHPKRTEADFGPFLDRFSALVIYLSLLALEKAPTLWERYSTGDNLIFVREDFNEPGRRPLWGELAAVGDPEVTRIAGVLAACLAKPVKDVPKLEAILKGSGPKPVQLAAVTPPPEKKWSATPSESGSIVELAPKWKVVWSRPGEKVETRWKKELKDGPVEVESIAEVRAPDSFVSAAIGLLGLVGGAALFSKTSSFEWGLVAAGSGLVTTRFFTRVQKRRVKYVEIKPIEQQVKEQFTVQVPGHPSAVAALQVGSDARALAVITRLGECGKWGLPDAGFRKGARRLPPFDRASFALNSAKAGLVNSRSALVVDIDKGSKTEINLDASDRASAVALSPDGGKLALGHQSGRLQMIESATKRTMDSVSAPTPATRVTALAFADDGQSLMVGMETGRVSIYHSKSKLEKVADGTHHKISISALAVAGAGAMFASADDGGSVTLFDKNGDKLRAVSVGKSVGALTFVGDGTIWALAVGCSDGNVKVLDVSNGSVIASHSIATAAVTSLAFAKGKMALAVGTSAGKVALLVLDA
ncbi:MAG TPA: protein kinase family protein [Myxococcaceae bacterium]|nr:protein kinase family protein [Myxococcaceae bacterium]